MVCDTVCVSFVGRGKANHFHKDPHKGWILGQRDRAEGLPWIPATGEKRFFFVKEHLELQGF